jgi:hypothetical protein
MIGTTSSGKSTIVNALIGRRIAPIEAGEMSGGVLRIKHGEGSHLKIEETEGAVWETGEWSGLSDEEIYNRIQQAMQKYQENKKRKSYIAPQIEVQLSILPGCDRVLSGLPEGLSIEFVDLPGLKSIKDSQNLKIIQSLVGNAFCLVALDYSHVDEEHRQALLNELKDVIKYLHDSTESMVFILNRIDRRSSDDFPLNKRVNLLKDEIKSTLNLPSKPYVIPSNALLLYYAQCAWGYNFTDNVLNCHEQFKSGFIKNLLIKSSEIIQVKALESEDIELFSWFTQLSLSFAQKEIQDTQVRKLVDLAYDWSGGSELWSCIRQRLEDSFAELVLVPILFPFFKSCDSFIAKMESTGKLKKITNEEEIQQAIQIFNQKRYLISEKSGETTKKMKKKIKKIIDTLQTSLSEAQNKIEQELKDEKLLGFKSLIETVNAIENDLNLNIIDPISDALSDRKMKCSELEETLFKSISSIDAKSITDAYDGISRQLEDFDEVDGYFVKKVRSDDVEAVKELEKLEKEYRLLFLHIKRTLQTRGELIFQAKSQECIKALLDLVNPSKEEYIMIVNEELKSLNVNDVVVTNYEQGLFSFVPRFPDNFFNNPSINGIESKIESVKTGIRDTGKKQGSCIDKKPIYEDIREDIFYKKINLPNGETMAETFICEIQNKKEDIWYILCQWIYEYLDWIHEQFIYSVNKTIEDINYHLRKQLNETEENLRYEISIWELIQKKNLKLSIIKQKVEQELIEMIKQKIE